MRKVLFFIAAGIMALAVFGARYERTSLIPAMNTPNGIAMKGDTVEFEHYLTGPDTVGWSFVDHTAGVDIFTSTIITTTPGSLDTIDVDEATAAAFTVWALDSARVWLNDTTAASLYLYYGGFDSRDWKWPLEKRVSQIIIGGIDSTVVTVQIWTE